MPRTIHRHRYKRLVCTVASKSNTIINQTCCNCRWNVFWWQVFAAIADTFGQVDEYYDGSTQVNLEPGDVCTRLVTLGRKRFPETFDFDNSVETEGH